MLLCRKTFETTENYIGLQNEQNDELRHKTFKTTQNNESDQITMNLHRFDVQTIKNVELRRKPFKTAKLQKWSMKWCQKWRSNYDEFASIWRPNDQKCWVTSQTFKTLNYKSDQNTMTCTDLTSKQFDYNVEVRRKTF